MDSLVVARHLVPADSSRFSSRHGGESPCPSSISLPLGAPLLPGTSPGLCMRSSWQRAAHLVWRRSRSVPMSVAALQSPSNSQSSLPGTVGRGTLPRTWSNPHGDVLTSVVHGKAWAAQRPFYWNGIDVGGRMGVVLLGDGTVWVHSPVALDGPLQDALRQIGPVRHIVSPNLEHCKYAEQWIGAYPGAKSYACPGLQEQRPSIPYSETVGEGHVAPPDWLGEFKITHMDCERNPFTGKPFFEEVIFCHEPSKVLFLTDFFWNYPESGLPLGSWAWKFGMDRIYHPFYLHLMVTSKARLRQLRDRILAQSWDTLVPCHGSVVTAHAKAAFQESSAA